ncbi:hypothetical protein FHT76_002102 [Rhizobium sp. BK176]|nr:hypothetical protein [Rhizobium sp. BK399]MCS3739220.1 hypothetical protein [Rhizobium sp. BK661]MCS4090455.1 hypothetical protein [Rhizobium sp. BK176]
MHDQWIQVRKMGTWSLHLLCAGLTQTGPPDRGGECRALFERSGVGAVALAHQMSWLGSG